MSKSKSMSMNIALLTIFYNSHQELKRLIDSIPKHDGPNRIIAIDGVFQYTIEKEPDLPLLSTDGSRDFLMSNDKINVFLCDMPHVLEVEKRNKYLELCKQLKTDVGIIVDTDEFFIYPDNKDPSDAWLKFRYNIREEAEKANGHNVFNIEMDDLGVLNYRPRIWLRPGEMTYLYNSHYHYGNPTHDYNVMEYYKSFGSCWLQHAKGNILGVKLAHNHNLRSEQYQKRRMNYQQYLHKFESLVQSQYKYDADNAHKLAANKNEVKF